MRGVWTIVHILGGRSVVPCRKGIHERTQAVHLLPRGEARKPAERRRFRLRPWSPRDALGGLRGMRQSGHGTVPAPRRPARLLQRLLQSSGWWRWWRPLLGQQTGTSAVPGPHCKHVMRPQHTPLRAGAFSSPWIEAKNLATSKSGICRDQKPVVSFNPIHSGLAERVASTEMENLG